MKLYRVARGVVEEKIEKCGLKCSSSLSLLYLRALGISGCSDVIYKMEQPYIQRDIMNFFQCNLTWCLS